MPKFQLDVEVKRGRTHITYNSEIEAEGPRTAFGIMLDQENISQEDVDSVSIYHIEDDDQDDE